MVVVVPIVNLYNRQCHLQSNRAAGPVFDDHKSIALYLCLLLFQSDLWLHNSICLRALDRRIVSEFVLVVVLVLVVLVL